MNYWRFNLKVVDVYCLDIQKKTKRLLKRVFGYKTIAEGLEKRKDCENLIEILTCKKPKDVTFKEIKEHNLCETYARYRTLDKVLELYLESVCLQKFTIKELEEYGTKRSRKN